MARRSAICAKAGEGGAPAACDEHCARFQNSAQHPHLASPANAGEGRRREGIYPTLSRAKSQRNQRSAQNLFNPFPTPIHSLSHSHGRVSKSSEALKCERIDRRGTRRFSEDGNVDIVEEVRRRGCSAEVCARRRNERRVHCLRGMKPQGPAELGSCCALNR